MRTLLALLLLCSSASAQDFNWAFDDPFTWSVERPGDSASPVLDEPVRDTDVPSFVHRINVANRGGSGTFIAPGVFITCKHLFEGLRGYEVSIDGKSVEASVTLAPSHDVAIVQLGSGAAAVPVGDAAYMAECIAFGFGSETVHRGVISNDDTLSLYAGESGIEQGDSGGAVFCEGKLVGVIRGKNPANPLVCYFTPIQDVAALVAPFTQPSGAPLPAAEAADKPSITIAVADFVCPPCDTLKGYQWDAFNVTWQTGGAESYPQISWQDSRGVKRVLTGAYTPSRVMWSYRETMK